MQKKLSLVLVFALVSALMALALTGCGPQNDQDKVKAAFNDAVSKVTNTSDENLQALFGDKLISMAKEAGVSPADISKALFSHMKAEVGDVTVNGNGATATVTVTNSDLAQARTNYQNSISEWAASKEAMESLSTGGQQALNKKALETLIEVFGSNDLEQRTSTFNVDFQKDGNGNWALAESSSSNLARNLCVGVDPAAFV